MNRRNDNSKIESELLSDGNDALKQIAGLVGLDDIDQSITNFELHQIQRQQGLDVFFARLAGLLVLSPPDPLTFFSSLKRVIAQAINPRVPAIMKNGSVGSPGTIPNTPRMAATIATARGFKNN